MGIETIKYQITKHAFVRDEGKYTRKPFMESQEIDESDLIDMLKAKYINEYHLGEFECIEISIDKVVTD